jgi:phospholipid/cholesterol/gamma-HCH transport system permease protein
MALETPPSRGPIADAATQAGLLAGFSATALVAVGRVLVRARLAWRECLGQAWFLASVTTGPALLMTIPLGGVVAVNIGAMAAQLGAEGFGGAVVAFVVVGQAAPLVCALVISGIGGSAICADLGSRKIREEIDALEVMGISIVERLVVPRIIAAVGVAVLLDGLVMAVGIGTSYGFQVGLLGSSSGSFLNGLTEYSRLADFVVSEIKAATFAVLAALVASYKGLTVRGGPQGVGDAVNESVVMSFILVFLANTAITELYPVVVTARGAY